MWQSPCLQMMVSSLIWHEDLLFLKVKWIDIHSACGGGIQRTGCILEETSCRTAAVNTAAWLKLRVTHRVTCLCQVRNPLPTIQERRERKMHFVIQSHIQHSDLFSNAERVQLGRLNFINSWIPDSTLILSFASNQCALWLLCFLTLLFCSLPSCLFIPPHSGQL